MVSQSESHLARDADGRLYDTRARYQQGDRVRIIRGEHGGFTGTVDMFLAHIVVNGQTLSAHGYRVVLDSGEIPSIKWDEVEAV